MNLERSPAGLAPALWLTVNTACLVLLLMPGIARAQLTYTTNNGTIRITRYLGPGGDLAVPDTIHGFPVTSIAGAAFANCTTLTSVSLGNRITNIDGYWAFRGCTSLRTITVNDQNPSYSSVDGVLFDRDQLTLVTYPGGRAGSYAIPNRVRAIGPYAFASSAALASVSMGPLLTTLSPFAFERCGSLTNIALGEGVTSIGRGAFTSCDHLASIVLPGSLTNFEAAAFLYCSSLRAISVAPGNPNFASMDGVLFDREQTRLIRCPPGRTGTYAVPEIVNTIAADAFAGCTRLTSLRLGDRVTGIENYAFYGCAGLTNAFIGSAVRSIAAYAFAECTSLTGVYCAGDAPSGDWSVFASLTGQVTPTVYYLPGTRGWSASFAACPTAFWVLPAPLILPGSAAVGANGFSFAISWATNAPVVVETSSDLTSPSWSPIATKMLNLNPGLSVFVDPQSTNYPRRFYRLRSL